MAMAGSAIVSAANVDGVGLTAGESAPSYGSARSTAIAGGGDEDRPGHFALALLRRYYTLQRRLVPHLRRLCARVAASEGMALRLSRF